MRSGVRQTLGKGRSVALFDSRDATNTGKPVFDEDVLNTPYAICAPVTGRVVSLKEVPDPAFSQGMLGEGLGFEAEQSVVVAPVTGTVVADVKTQHALLIKNEVGVEVLVHVGVDTVSLRGNGFKALVEKGDHVKVGQPVIEFDSKLISEQGLDNTVILTVVNAKSFSAVEPVVEADVVEAGAVVLRAER